MPLQGTVQKAASAIIGFDCNQPLTALECKAFKEAGMDFCIRYVPRTASLMSGNLTYEEAGIILASGLAISAVQHVPLPNWMPTGELGSRYGAFASQYAKNTVGLPEGMVLWLDLESVSTAATPQDVIDYCSSWYASVFRDGYVPGLYVGWQPGLNGEGLYNLPFKHYWRAYNADFTPDPRGYQLIQHTQKTLGNVTYDPNTTQEDKMGDSLLWAAPQ
jgi:hypothetical protein